MVEDRFVPHEGAQAQATDAQLARTSDHAAIADLAVPSATYVEAEAVATNATVNEILDVLRDAGLIPANPEAEPDPDPEEPVVLWFDDLNRADEAQLAAPYTAIMTGVQKPPLASNQILTDDASYSGFRQPAIQGSDISIEVTVSAISPTSGKELEIILRDSGELDTYDGYVVNTNGSSFQLRRYDNGNAVVLSAGWTTFASVGPAFVDGSKLRLQMIGDELMLYHTAPGEAEVECETFIDATYAGPGTIGMLFIKTGWGIDDITVLDMTP